MNVVVYVYDVLTGINSPQNKAEKQLTATLYNTWKFNLSGIFEWIDPPFRLTNHLCGETSRRVWYPLCIEDKLPKGLPFSIRFKRQVISCISRVLRRHVNDEPLLYVVPTECQRTCHNYMLLTLWYRDKWPAVCRRHIQVHFCVWKRFYFTGIPNCPINNLPAFVQIITWCQSAHKPLSETIMVYYTDA